METVLLTDWDISRAPDRPPLESLAAAE